MCWSNESFEKDIPKEVKQSFTLCCYMAFQIDQNRRGAVVVQEFKDGLSQM